MSVLKSCCRKGKPRVTRCFTTGGCNPSIFLVESRMDVSRSPALGFCDLRLNACPSLSGRCRDVHFYSEPKGERRSAYAQH
jgi:hypothetical protein